MGDSSDSDLFWRHLLGVAIQAKFGKYGFLEASGCARVGVQTKHHLKGVKWAIAFSWESRKRGIAAVPLLSDILLSESVAVCVLLCAICMFICFGAIFLKQITT